MDTQRSPRVWRVVSVWVGLCAGLWALLPGPVQAREHTDWRSLIQAHAEEQQSSSGVRTVLQFSPDEPLPPRCQSGLRIAGPLQAVWRGRVRVQLQCSQPVWRWAVPVNVQRVGQVVQAQRPLPSGTVLQPADLRLVEVDFSVEPAGAATRLEEAVGREMSRPLREGSAIALNILRAATVIKSGDRVSVRLLGSTFEILSEGVAQQNGGAGDSIRVKMADGKQITAEVVSSGEVTIRL